MKENDVFKISLLKDSEESKYLLKMFQENKPISFTIGKFFICEVIIREIEYNYETNLNTFSIIQLYKKEVKS